MHASIKIEGRRRGPRRRGRPAEPCHEAAAQANEIFIPVLVYRTGAYAPNGVPWADGFVDYLKLVNERDGGVNGIKLAFEECETGYATDRGVECYERLKSKKPVAVNPLSTGITFALTEKVAADKIAVISTGYGRVGVRRRQRLRLELPATGHLLVRRRHAGAARGEEGQRSRARRSRSSTTTRPTARSRSTSSRSTRRSTASSSSSSRSRTPASSRRPPGCRSASSDPTTCSCGAGAS